MLRTIFCPCFKHSPSTLVTGLLGLLPLVSTVSSISCTGTSESGNSPYWDLLSDLNTGNYGNTMHVQIQCVSFTKVKECMWHRTDDIEVCDSTAIMYIIYENFKREEKYNYSTFGPIRNIFRKQNKGHKLSIVQCDINNKYLWHQDKRNNKECNLHAYCFSVLLNFTFLFPKTEYHHHQHLLRRHGSIDSELDVRR